MIRIRYPDFSTGASDLAGLHGIAEPSARGVTVYLLPGLTGRQRKAVLRRLRQEASRGCGPALPLLWLAIALGVDRMRTAGETAVAVFRLHPMATLLPGVAAAAMALFVLSSTGGAPGTTPRTGLAGVLVGNGHRASAGGPAVGSASDSAVSPAVSSVIGDPSGTGLGGSGLGAAVPATGWRARPHVARRKHRAHGRQTARQTASSRHREMPRRGQPGYRRRPLYRGRPGYPGQPGSRGRLWYQEQPWYQEQLRYRGAPLSPTAR